MQVVKEDAADASGFMAVGQIEIIVTPFFEARIIRHQMFLTGGLHGGMESLCIHIRLAAFAI